MQKNAHELLEAGLNELQITWDHAAITKLETFIDELLLFNARFDLVNAQSVDEIIVRHIFDSLAALPFFKQAHCTKILDIGSGAGFPGIPLAIFLPEKKLTLAERSERRVNFLQNIQAVLRLHTVEIVQADFKTLRTNYDSITTRALTQINAKLLNEMLRLLNDDGELILYKGTAEKTKAEMLLLDTEIQKHAAVVQIIPLQVPFLAHERCIVKIHKGVLPHE